VADSEEPSREEREETARKYFGMSADEFDQMIADQHRQLERMMAEGPHALVVERLADDQHGASGDALYELLWADVAGLTEDEMTPEQLAFYYAEHVNMQVLNGGLTQYFLNTRGDEIDEARAALETIGAPHHAKVFDRAVEIWRAERAVSGSCWEEDLDHRAYTESRIGRLDDDWEAEDIVAIELGYVRANLPGFVGRTS
jgi:hypothetical protein